MYPDPNPLKQKLAKDDAVFGIWVQIESAEIVEIAGTAGFDYIIIDCEHGMFGLEAAIRLIRVAELAKLRTIVRVPDDQPTFIRLILEAGADGIMVPNVKTVRQAGELIAAARYKDGDNGGQRGACPAVRAMRNRMADWGDFLRWSNENTLVVLMIESEEGIANMPEIARLPGIDILMFGRFDVYHDIGAFNAGAASDGNSLRAESPQVDALYERFIAISREAGIPFTSRLDTDELERTRAKIAEMTARGARMFTMGGDFMTLLDGFTRKMRMVRAAQS